MDFLTVFFQHGKYCLNTDFTFMRSQHITVFLQSNVVATVFFFVFLFFLFVLVRLLLEGGYYLRVAFISLGSRQIATTLNKVHVGDTARSDGCW